MLDRLPSRIGPAAVAVGVAGIAVFALAFFVGRLTASGSAAVTPTLATVHSAPAAISLPQLSQAAPLPALVARQTVQQAAPPVQQAPTQVQTVQIRVPAIPAASKHTATKPVRIVGSG